MSEATDKLSPKFTTRIHREKIRLLRAQLPFVLIAVVFVTTGVAIIFWNVVDVWLLALWMGGQYVLSLFRGWLSARFDRVDLNDDEARRWGWIFALTSGVSGCLWGWAAFLFMQPDNPFYLISLVMVILGMAAGSMPSLSAYLPAYAAYMVPTLSGMELEPRRDRQPGLHPCRSGAGVHGRESDVRPERASFTGAVSAPAL